MEGASINSRKSKAKNSKGVGAKYILLITTLLITAISICAINYFIYVKTSPKQSLRENIYGSMLDSKTRLRAYNEAVKLNGGTSANTCVYFISEVLRINGIKIDDSICNTTQLLGIMKKEGYKKETDYKKLMPGDICFTTDEKMNKNGTPTHTYIFMAWKEAGKYDYAYICDNQSKDYGGKLYHLRNITKTETINGNAKEPFSFFMYK